MRCWPFGRIVNVSVPGVSTTRELQPVLAEINEIAVGLVMVILTTMIHASFMVAGMRALEWRKARFGRVTSHGTKGFLVSIATAWMFLAIVVEAWIWALVYLLNPMITTLPDIETALYFSMVTYSTLGYGDVVLIGKWRILASIQAANGVIVFGWTTALIFIWIQNIYRRE